MLASAHSLFVRVSGTIKIMGFRSVPIVPVRTITAVISHATVSKIHMFDEIATKVTDKMYIS